MKAVVFSAMAEPTLLALLATDLRTAEFNGVTVKYLLAKSVESGMPFTTISLQGDRLRLDVQTHGIAAVLSGESVAAMGFVPG